MRRYVGWMLAVGALVGCSAAAKENPSVVEATLRDGTLAVVRYGEGKVIFIDEGRNIPGAGISFVEVGDVDLTELLEKQNATALEVFLAISPEGTPAPERLVQHHREVARTNANVPMEPRILRSATLKLASFTNQGVNQGSNCWDWGGSGFDSAMGKQDFDYASFKTHAKAYASMVGPVSSKVTTVNGTINSDFNLEGTTSSSQRSLALCLTKTVRGDLFDPATMNLERACKTLNGPNGVKLRVQIFTENLAHASVLQADFTVEGFGTGARFRSNYVNAGGAPRPYWAAAKGILPDDENEQAIDLCDDEVHAVWHWKFDPPIVQPDAGPPCNVEVCP